MRFMGGTAKCFPIGNHSNSVSGGNNGQIVNCVNENYSQATS